MPVYVVVPKRKTLNTYVRGKGGSIISIIPPMIVPTPPITPAYLSTLLIDTSKNWVDFSIENLGEASNNQGAARKTDLDTAVVFVIDGGGEAITPGSKGYLPVPFDCEITGWKIMADQEGEIVVDVKGSYTAVFPTASSIAGTEKPHLDVIAPQINIDLDLTTWTTKIWVLNNILEFVVDSVATIKKVTIMLIVKRT